MLRLPYACLGTGVYPVQSAGGWRGCNTCEVIALLGAGYAALCTRGCPIREAPLRNSQKKHPEGRWISTVRLLKGDVCTSITVKLAEGSIRNPSPPSRLRKRIKKAGVT